MSKRSVIVFCGGGSGGHLVPSVAVAQELIKKNSDVTPVFFCSPRRDEHELIERMKWKAHSVHAGKFPSGFTYRWLTFPILFPLSLLESLLLLLRVRPKKIFSKGGYVSVPVCIVAWALRIPIVLHESDAVPGKGNKLIAKLARRICLGFPMSSENPATKKTVYTGNPVRADMALGLREEGLRIAGFSGEKPVLLVLGGSQGAQALNDAVIRHHEELLRMCDIIHITGAGKSVKLTRDGYRQYEFVDAQLAHFYALCDLALTRAGAGTLSELALVSKPAITVPLEGVAHDHQVTNARILERCDAVSFLPQNNLRNLPDHVSTLLGDATKRASLGASLHRFFPPNAADRIADILIA